MYFDFLWLTQSFLSRFSCFSLLWVLYIYLFSLSFLYHLSLSIPFSSKRDFVSHSFCVRLYFYLSSTLGLYPLTFSIQSVSSSPSTFFLFRWHAFRPLQPRVWTTGFSQSLRAKEKTVLVAMQRRKEREGGIRKREREKETETTRRATAMIIIRRPNNQCDPPGKKPRASPCVRSCSAAFFTPSHSLFQVSLSPIFFLSSSYYSVIGCQCVASYGVHKIASIEIALAIIQFIRNFWNFWQL